MKTIIVCSGCGKEFVPEFVNEGESVFCGKTSDSAVAVRKEIP